MSFDDGPVDDVGGGEMAILISMSSVCYDVNDSCDGVEKVILILNDFYSCETLSDVDAKVKTISNGFCDYVEKMISNGFCDYVEKTISNDF